MKDEKKILKTESVVKKDFKYSVGEQTFLWTLRIDIKQELKNGIEIAKQFIIDAENELKKL
jgi:hypothetical protein